MIEIKNKQKNKTALLFIYVPLCINDYNTMKKDDIYIYNSDFIQEIKRIVTQAR